MSDIFISYASEDRSRAAAVAKALEAKGWSVWWDRNIPTGKRFHEVIEEEIGKARCMVVLLQLSPNRFAASHDQGVEVSRWR
jgi:hypothetical protein